MTLRPPGSRRTRVAAGVLAAVVVAAAAAWLLWPPPSGPLALHTGTSHYLVDTTVGSARVGTTSVTVAVTDRAGHPLDQATVTVEPIMPLMGHAAPAMPADFSGDGHYLVAGLDLMMTGPWELRLSIAAPAGVDQLTLPISVSG